MKNITKVGLIISGVLIALGVLICGAVLTVYSFNMSVFDTDSKRTAETFTPDGEFSSVDISTSFDDIKIMHSLDSSCRIEAYQGGNDGYSVSIDGGVLKIEQQDKRKWYEFINITFGVEKYGICVYLPEKAYEKMNIATASGDIDINGISSNGLAITAASGDILASEIICDDMELNTASGDAELIGIKSGELFVKTVSGDMEIASIEGEMLEFDSTSGEVDIKNITADNLKIKTTSGDITAENTVITKETKVNSTSGCCEFEASDSGEFDFKTVSGDIECELLSAKYFETETTSGNIKVPFSDKDGGLFKAETTSGNISVEYTY